ncbi:MAG: NUDIX hydrolase [Armatimonadota bacterium]
MNNHEDLRETLIGSAELFRGKLLTLTVDTVRLPDGREATREVVHHGGAVGMVPLASNGDVLLVRQWRHAPGVALLEIPAGGISRGEEAEHCARRELAEEVGFVPRRLDLLTTIYTAPGYVGEAIHLYVARDLVPERAEGDEDENLQVERMTMVEALAACRDGRICDGKSISALMLARDFLQQEALD